MPSRVKPPTLRRAHRRHMADAVGNTVWAIDPRAIEPMRLVAMTGQRPADLRVFGDEHDLDEQRRVLRSESGIALLGVHGVLSPRPNIMTRYFGGTCTRDLVREYQAALDDPLVRAIVLHCDSPGGDAQGVEEFAQLVRQTRGKKTVIAAVDLLAASGAYWIAAAADEVVASPSSLLGSIGVYHVHLETSKLDRELGFRYTLISAGKHKTDGNPWEPLSDQGARSLQERVNTVYRMFIAAVADGREVSEREVEDEFGQGKVLGAELSVAQGLADRIATFDEVLAELRGSASSGAVPQAAAHGGRPVTAKEQNVNPRIKAWLFASGLISAADASDDIARAAVNAWFMARGQETPATDEAILTALTRHADRQPPTPPTGGPQTAAAGQQATQQPNQAGGGAVEFTSPQAREQERLAERQRIQDIRARASLLNASGFSLDEAAISAAIDEGLTADAAAGRWMDQHRQTNAPVRPVGGDGASAADTIRFNGSQVERLGAMTLYALESRLGMHPDGRAESDTPASLRAPAHVVQGGRELRHMSLVELATNCLKACGVRVEGVDRDTIAQMALQQAEILAPMRAMDSYNVPASFPNLLSNLAGKIMDVAQSYAPATYTRWAKRIGNVPDLKPKTIHQVGEFGELPEWADGLPAEESTIAEDVSWIIPRRFGDEWRMTPVMMANDDMGAFQEAAQDKAIAWQMTMNRACVDLIVGNPTLNDGFALFDDTNHGNFVTPGGGPVSVTQLDLVRRRLRKQKGISAKRTLNLRLATVLVPVGLETVSEQVLLPLGVVPVTDGTANPFRGQATPLVEPQLDDSSTVAWYGFSDPMMAAAIIYCFQAGYENLRRRTYFENKTGSMVLQVEGRGAAAVRNYRGAVRNAGQ